MIPVHLFRQVPLTAALLLLIAYFLSPFFTYYFGPGGFNDQRVLQLLWMSACLITLLLVADYRRWLIEWMQGFSIPTLSCLVLFFAAVTASSLLAPDTLRALQEVGLYALLLLSIAAVARELSGLDKNELAVLLTFALTIWCVVYALYFLIYYFSR